MCPFDNEPIPFWFPNGRGGASEAELERAERYVGYRIPGALRDLLVIQDGGVSNYTAYKQGDRQFPLLPIFRAGGDPATATLMRAYDVREAFGVPDGVIAFAGQGESWWGLDYRCDSDAPGVVFRLDLEHDVEPVATTFDGLLASLVEE